MTTQRADNKLLVPVGRTFVRNLRTLAVESGGVTGVKHARACGVYSSPAGAEEGGKASVV